MSSATSNCQLNGDSPSSSLIASVTTTPTAGTATKRRFNALAATPEASVDPTNPGDINIVNNKLGKRIRLNANGAMGDMNRKSPSLSDTDPLMEIANSPKSPSALFSTSPTTSGNHLKSNFSLVTNPQNGIHKNTPIVQSKASGSKKLVIKGFKG